MFACRTFSTGTLDDKAPVRHAREAAKLPLVRHLLCGILRRYFGAVQRGRGDTAAMSVR